MKKGWILKCGTNINENEYTAAFGISLFEAQYRTASVYPVYFDIYFLNNFKRITLRKAKYSLQEVKK